MAKETHMDDGWMRTAMILDAEYVRLKRNQGLYPQVAEDYKPDLDALSKASSICRWNAEHNIPFPTLSFPPREARTDDSSNDNSKESSPI